MKRRTKYFDLPVALLALGSAISLSASLSSCGEAKTSVSEGDEGKDIISRAIENLATTTVRNGQTTRVFRAPVMEEHAFARPAYQEFRRGIDLVGYDTLGMPSSHVEADYALYWTARELWELKGNVVVEGEGGRTLRTQQLQWDVKLGKFYSNVDSKVEEGEDVMIGEGFEADENFESWTFRKVSGRINVSVEPGGSGGSGDSDGFGDSGGSGDSSDSGGRDDSPVTPAKTVPAAAGGGNGTVSQPAPTPSTRASSAQSRPASGGQALSQQGLFRSPRASSTIEAVKSAEAVKAAEAVEAVRSEPLKATIPREP